MKRLKKLDNVKWILTLLIVLYHIQYPFYDERQKTAFMFLKNMGDCVVPAFSLISGFLFFRSVDSIQDVITKMKRRILTLLVPYLLWNIINVFVFYIIYGIINSKPIEISFFEDIIMGDASPHFWYIYMLMFWCVFAPVLFIAYKNPLCFSILLLCQFAYIFYKGNGILHSRFIYILYTWGGVLGANKPNLIQKIETLNIKNKVVISVVSWVIYFAFSVFNVVYDVDMGIKVWIYAIKGVFLILATINLPLLWLGKVTKFRYSFWMFAVHYWLDAFMGSYIINYFNNALMYQSLLCMIVLLVGLGIGSILYKIFPKAFAVLTGGRLGE